MKAGRSIRKNGCSKAILTASAAAMLVVCIAPALVSATFIPPDPTNLANATGDFYVSNSDKNAGRIGSERVSSCNVSTARWARDADASGDEETRGDTGTDGCTGGEGDRDRAASGATVRLHRGLCDGGVLAGCVCGGATAEVGTVSLVKSDLMSLWRVCMAIAGTVPATPVQMVCVWLTARLHGFPQDFCVNLVKSRGYICGYPRNIE